MDNFNKALCETILHKCRNLSLENQQDKKDGRFLADKSYAFDTMFFVCRYINFFRFGDTFIRDHRERENNYIADLFSLGNNTSQVKNYFTEALALLRFLGAVEYSDNNYKIVDDEIIDIFSSSFENSYIFLYLLSYSVLKHHQLWDLYTDFCLCPEGQKQAAYDNFRTEYIKADIRVKDPAKYWAFFTPKYPMVVLNYANGQNMISRTGKVKSQTVKRTDISLNTEGTRNNLDIPKKNDYLAEMSESYIIESLRPYLVTPPEEKNVEYSDTISIDIADTKLKMIAQRYNIPVKHKSQTDKYRYSKGAKTRTVQGEFRGGLFRKTPHVCPVCGFSYKDFLIASHIKPYAMCDDTYDAMNPHNGLLLCPICDKLFESANLMTIDSATGTVVLDESISGEKDFEKIKGRIIDFAYIDCERKHYLRWHNEFYNQKHNKNQE